MTRNLTFVTGAAGFIGSNIATDIASRGGRVVVCDRFGRGEAWRYLESVTIHDIVTPERAIEWLRAHAADVESIVHMGAISSTTETDIDALIANNIRFTLDLWDVAAEHDWTFVYASSAATYGDGTNGFIDDDRPEALARLRPLNAYGWSKHFVDRRFVDDVRAGRPSPSRWAGLKFFNVYGPNEGHKGSMRSVVHQIYPKVAVGESVALFKSDHPDYTDGGQLRDFVYVGDCVEVVRRMLAASELSGVYNVGTGQARSFADLAIAVHAAVGAPPLIDYVEMPDALKARYQYFTQADTEKLRRDGFAPDFGTLEERVALYASLLRVELAQE